jgi:hypothetical protein
VQTELQQCQQRKYISGGIHKYSGESGSPVRYAASGSIGTRLLHACSDQVGPEPLTGTERGPALRDDE